MNRPSLGGPAQRWGLREQIVRAQGFSLYYPNVPQIKAKGHGRTRADAKFYRVPILPRSVVHDCPGLHLDFAGIAQRKAVARFPRGRFRYVRQFELMLLGPTQLNLHLDEPGAGTGDIGGVHNRLGCVRARIGNRKRLQKVIDLVGRHLQMECIAFDIRVAFKIGDAIAVNNDSVEGCLRSSSKTGIRQLERSGKLALPGWWSHVQVI